MQISELVEIIGLGWAFELAETLLLLFLAALVIAVLVMFAKRKKIDLTIVAYKLLPVAFILQMAVAALYLLGYATGPCFLAAAILSCACGVAVMRNLYWGCYIGAELPGMEFIQWILEVLAMEMVLGISLAVIWLLSKFLGLTIGIVILVVILICLPLLYGYAAEKHGSYSGPYL